MIAVAAVRTHRHALARPGMAVDRLVDRALRPIRRAPHEGEVAALQRAGAAVIGELGGERAMGAVGLGDDHQAGRVLVEAVDDAGPAHAADAGQARAAMGDQRVDQGAGAVARRGMDDEAARLVDDDDVVVLVDDDERDRLRAGLRGLRRRQRDRDPVARIDVVARIADRAAAHGDMPGEDQGLEARARQFLDAGGERAVEPLPGLRRGDHRLHCFRCFRRFHCFRRWFQR